MRLQRHADFNVNYEDERFQNVNNQKNEKLNEVNQLYDGMIQQSDKFYNQQADLAKQYEKTQNQIAQNNYTQNINQINQEQDKLTKDYEKEQKGSYTDYQKAINQYGVQAENMAAAGIDNSGYNESSKVMAFNAYQNRLASARESYNLAVTNYNNKRIEAKNTLDVATAQNALQSLQAQLESALQGFQYKNTLLTEQLNQKQNIDNTYYGRWQDVLNQINQENQMNYQKEQDERNYQFQREQFEYQKQQDAIANALAQQKVSSSGSSRSSSGSSSKNNFTDTSNYAVNTEYYKGDLNPDASNGTFSNGYQPNNVNGKKLSKTGDTIDVSTKTLSGESRTVNQNVWKTKDGTKYYWDGTKNKYIKMK